MGWHSKRDTIPLTQRMAEIGSCEGLHHSAQPGNILQNCVMQNFHFEKLPMYELQVLLEVPEGFEYFRFCFCGIDTFWMSIHTVSFKASLFYMYLSKQGVDQLISLCDSSITKWFTVYAWM